jgi:DNA-binding response OmpR family regulator
LVIEPQQSIQDTLRLSLLRVGYEVIAARNEADGIKQFKQNQAIELVLTEASMPGIDGFGICSEIRKFSSVPIVLLSDLKHIDQVVYGFSLGADDYITKPIYFPVLRARIEAILQRCAKKTDQRLG